MSTEKYSYVYSIKGLFLSKNNLSETIVEDIDEFISIAPSLADNIRTSLFDRKDSFWFIQQMSMALFLLKSVNANWLQTEAESILQSANMNHLDVCRKKIEPFISDFLSLSIEMQMAQKRAAEEQSENKKNVVEAYTDIVNILTAVSSLIAINDYDRAREILVDMDDLGDNSISDELVQLLHPSSGEMAMERVKQLKDEYTSKIEEIDNLRDIDKKEILAVDDRPDMLRMVAGMLREHYKVLTATSGVSALKILEKKNTGFIYS